MTNNILKYRDYLRLFDLKSSKGTQLGNQYEFVGIQAQCDFDGYTCWIAYKNLTH